MRSGRRRAALRRGIAWGSDYVFALGSIRRGIADPQLPEAFADGDRAPVLLLPGVLEDWTMMRAIAGRLNAAGHPIHALRSLRRNTGSLAEAALLGDAHLEAKGLTGWIVVAHSKGGLIGKRMLLDDGEGRIERLVAVATPWQGSRLAPLIPMRSVYALRPGDPEIRALGEDAAVNERIVSIFPRFDPHIPGGSELPGAVNVPVDAMGHFRILEDPAVLDAVETACSL